MCGAVSQRCGLKDPTGDAGDGDAAVAGALQLLQRLVAYIRADADDSAVVVALGLNSDEALKEALLQFSQLMGAVEASGVAAEGRFLR